jgi:type IV pilus assembly protein PilP
MVVLVSATVALWRGAASGEESPGHAPAQLLPQAERSQSLAPPLPLDSARVGATGQFYHYDPQGRRDPMEPLVKEQPPEQLVPVEDTLKRPLGPLERYDISALKLVAIMWGDLGRRALVKAPDGKGYFVAVNTYMGKYGGKVVAVEKDKVVIEERYKNLQEQIIPKTLTIPLRRKNEKEG